MDVLWFSFFYIIQKQVIVR